MLKIIIPIIVVAGAVLLGKYLIATGPEAKKKPASERIPVVEVVSLESRPYTVEVKASGIVKAGIQSHLVSEVSGKVVSVAEDFQEGSYFQKGQILLEIDKANYENALAIAASDVAANEASLKQLEQEQKSNRQSIHLAEKNLAIGRKEVARVTALWNKKLVARSVVDAEEQQVNQLEQKLQELSGVQSTYASRRNTTQAKINAARARLRQEQLNLSRTTLRAPYRGRVLKKNIDIGQFVSAGTVLGEIYATDFVNVEIPLPISQYDMLDMPEAFRGESIDPATMPEVILTTPKGHMPFASNQARWIGRIVRSSAALDAQSRLINVIARIDKPFEASESVTTPIRIGQYLKASIRGKTFDNVYVLPPVSVLYNREVRLLKEGRINVEPVDVLWNTGEETVIKTARRLNGKQLIITALEQAAEGMKAITVEEERKRALAEKPSRKPSASDGADVKTGQKRGQHKTAPVEKPVSEKGAEQHSSFDSGRPFHFVWQQTDYSDRIASMRSVSLAHNA